MFKRIIVATDLSDASYAVVNCLGGLKAYGAEECLLLQCLSMQESVSLALSYTTDALEKNLEDQKQLLEKQGFKVETRIVTGPAKREINRIASDEEYSVIVVGAQEQTMVSEAFSSEIAYDVIHYALKPVLLIRLKDIPENGVSCIRVTGCNISNHILFPTDFSDNADLAFSYVQNMVSDGVKKVTLLHVQDQVRISPHLMDKLEEFNRIDTARLEEMKKVLQSKGDVEVDIVLRFGSPTAEIIKLVEELNVQLVVMGSQGRGYIKEIFLGSVSHNIARHSTASVLLIPAKRD